MHLSINKKKIYFYLISFILLSTIFNKDIIKDYESITKVEKIEVIGLSAKEQINIKKDVEIFKNKNIFFINKKEIIDKLINYNFIDKFVINKIFPSKIKIFIEKTKLLGVTFVKGNRYYIGNNGKLISISEVENTKNLPVVFGKFPIGEFLNLQKKNKKKKSWFDKDSKILLLSKQKVGYWILWWHKIKITF